MSKVSVIIPVYNCEEYLAECIESVITQDYFDIEVIIVNDGSTDKTPYICNTYSNKDNRIRVKHGVNRGLSEARNMALGLAVGEFLMFVDSDDILLPQAISRLYDSIKKTDADIAEGKIVRKIIKKPYSDGVNFKKREYSNIEALNKTLYQDTLSSSVCGKLFNKSLLDQIRFKSNINYEDLDIYYRILEKTSKIVYLDVPVYFYRKRKGSLLNCWNPGRLHVLQITKNIEEYMEKLHPEILSAAKDRRLSANFNMFILCHKNYEYDIALECWDLIKSYRIKSLFNPSVRKKNKFGILLSFFGKKPLIFLSKFFYK